MINKQSIMPALVYILAIIIIIVAVYFQISNQFYIDSLIKTEASIHQISNSSNNSSIYVDYDIKNKKYSSVILINKKKVNISDKITIYCNSKKKTECFYEIPKSYYGYYLLILAIMLINVSIIYFRKLLN